MSALSNAYEVLVYNWLWRPGTSVTRHTAMWLAFFTAVSDADAGTGTEVSTSGTGYARIDVTSAFSAPDSVTGTGSNTADIVSGVPTANWGTITHVGFFTASTGGTAISRLVACTPPKTVNNGDPAVRFAAGELVLSVA